VFAFCNTVYAVLSGAEALARRFKAYVTYGRSVIFFTSQAGGRVTDAENTRGGLASCTTWRCTFDVMPCWAGEVTRERIFVWMYRKALIVQPSALCPRCFRGRNLTWCLRNETIFEAPRGGTAELTSFASAFRSRIETRGGIPGLSWEGSYCILDPAAVFGHVNKHVRYFNVEKYCEAALNRENNTKRSWGATMEQSGARYLWDNGVILKTHWGVSETRYKTKLKPMWIWGFFISNMRSNHNGNLGMLHTMLKVPCTLT